MDSAPARFCESCQANHPLTVEFWYRRKDSSSLRCKAATDARHLAWRQQNREKVREASRLSRQRRLEQSRAESREWQRRNSDRARENARAWAERNPEKMRVFRRRSALARYWPDKTHAEALVAFQEMYAKQGGCCAICKHPPTSGRGNTLHVDHDHETGKVRGLLCHSCNTSLGGFRDSQSVLWAAIEYLVGECLVS